MFRNDLPWSCLGFIRPVTIYQMMERITDTHRLVKAQDHRWAPLRREPEETLCIKSHREDCNVSEQESKEEVGGLCHVVSRAARVSASIR